MSDGNYITVALDEARHSMMGYRDGNPGTPEDALRLAEVREQCILSYQKSLNFLTARLRIADPQQRNGEPGMKVQINHFVPQEYRFCSYTDAKVIEVDKIEQLGDNGPHLSLEDATVVPDDTEVTE